MTANDLDLLHRYAGEGSEECFTALVTRSLYFRTGATK